MISVKSSVNRSCFLHQTIIAVVFVDIIGFTFSGGHALLSFAEYHITDFRLPQSSAMDFDIFGDLNSSYNNTYDTSTDFSLAGRLGLDFNGFSGTEDKDLCGALRFVFGPQLYKYNDNDTSYEIVSTGISIDEKLNSYVYIHKTNFFGAPTGRGHFSWSYDRYEPDWYFHDLYGDYYASFLIGYGRLRDGTDAWRAMEVEKILLSEGIINEPLGSTAILNLAQTINREREYGMSFDRAEKHYYKAIENMLQSFGIDHVPAYVWFKIKEVLEEHITLRKFGLQLGVGPHAQGSASYHLVSKDSISISSSGGNPRVDLMFSLNSAYPLTYRLQFNETAYLYVGENGMLFDLRTGITYLIAIKLEIELATNMERYIVEPPSIKKFQQSTEFNVIYYLEDNMSVVFHNIFRHVWDRDAVYSSMYRNQFSSGITFNYDVW